MEVIKPKNHLIERSLRFWLSQYPESFHPLDMKRFYTFVKNVCRYGRKRRDSDWLREKILKNGKYFTAENLDKYCCLFEELQDFHKINSE